MLCVLSVDDGYIEINGNIVAIVHNKEDATEIEVNDFISTVKSIKESTGISDEIDMDFNDNVGKVKMSMDDFFRQCTACGGNWGAMLLTGIKNVFPDGYDAVREQYNSMDFSDGGVRAFSFLCEWVTAHGVYENRE